MKKRKRRTRAEIERDHLRLRVDDLEIALAAARAGQSGMARKINEQAQDILRLRHADTDGPNLRAQLLAVKRERDALLSVLGDTNMESSLIKHYGEELRRLSFVNDGCWACGFRSGHKPGCELLMLLREMLGGEEKQRQLDAAREEAEALRAQ